MSSSASMPGHSDQTVTRLDQYLAWLQARSCDSSLRMSSALTSATQASQIHTDHHPEDSCSEVQIRARSLQALWSARTGYDGDFAIDDLIACAVETVMQRPAGHPRYHLHDLDPLSQAFFQGLESRARGDLAPPVATNEIARMLCGRFSTGGYTLKPVLSMLRTSYPGETSGSMTLAGGDGYGYDSEPARRGRLREILEFADHMAGQDIDTIDIARHHWGGRAQADRSSNKYRAKADITRIFSHSHRSPLGASYEDTKRMVQSFEGYVMFCNASNTFERLDQATVFVLCDVISYPKSGDRRSQIHSIEEDLFGAMISASAAAQSYLNQWLEGL